MPKLQKPASSDKNEFIPTCKCSDPKCKVNKELGQKASNLLGWSLNTTMTVLTLLKEASAATPVPGLRQAAGGTLAIVEAFANRSDNKAAYKQLAQQCIELSMIVTDFVTEAQNEAKVIPQRFITRLERFSGIIQDTENLVNKMLHRGFITWLIFHKADQVKITGFSKDMNHAVVAFQLFMSMDQYVGLDKKEKFNMKKIHVDPTPEEEEEIKNQELDPETVKKVKKRMIEDFLSPKIEEWQKEQARIRNTNTVTNTGGNVTSTTGPVQISAGPNSTFSNVGTSTVTNYQNMNNDNSNTVLISGPSQDYYPPYDQTPGPRPYQNGIPYPYAPDSRPSVGPYANPSVPNPGPYGIRRGTTQW